jgi:hypothetical protein
VGHWDRLRFGGEELGVIWICRIGQDPLPASRSYHGNHEASNCCIVITVHRSCRGNHEGKEGMEWKVSRESLITMGWLPTGQTVLQSWISSLK